MGRGTAASIVLLVSSVLAASPAAEAQRATKTFRVGYLSDESRSLGRASFEPIAQGLRDLGYVAGKNVAFEYRFADGNVSTLPGLATELVRQKVDVIITVGTQATRAAKESTGTTPIVFTRIADPVALGLVQSLARPGGNLTGVSVLTVDLAPKWLELLSEAIPGIKRVGVFWDPSFPPAALQVTELERAARVLNIELRPVEVRRADALDEAVRTVIDHGAHALIVTTAQLFAEQQRRLAELTLERRLPTMWYRREPVEAGGLMSYGTNFVDMYRRAATYVDKILKGTKPADLPVEQPATFELVINLRTAKALGLTIPQTVIHRADLIIR